MIRLVVLALLCLGVATSAVATSASPASAASTGYRWSSDEKWAFVDSWADWATLKGYRYPNLYADCLQKSAAVMYPSYTAFMRDASSPRWSKSTAVMHCILVDGQKWSDSF